MTATTPVRPTPPTVEPTLTVSDLVLQRQINVDHAEFAGRDLVDLRPLTASPQVAPTSVPVVLARASGVAPSAVRFYEKYGLVTSQRTAGNQRRFYEIDACLIKIIKVAQRVGLSVAEIRQLMSDLPERREITIDDWFRLRHRLEDEVRQRIQALADVLDDLTSDQKLCELPPAQRARVE